MKPLRIVMLMVEPPLPFGNAAARWFYVLLKGLVDRGHDVRAFATCSRAEDAAKAAELFPPPRYDLRCYEHSTLGGLRAKWRSLRRPYSYMFSEAMQADWWRTLARGADVIHLEQLWSAWMGLSHVDRALLNVHHLTWIDLSETQFASSSQRRSMRRMMATERRLLRRMRWIRSCSPRLVPEMLSVNPGLDVTVVPVGIDPEQYPYIPDERRVPQRVVSVIGNMEWYPTRSAAVRLLERLWPEIKRRVPSATAQIIGWGARSSLAKYLGMPDVTIEENVPDIRPYFERSGVLLYAPSRGSGMKIKILEAMGFGVPVVTTSEGVEGIPAVDGEHVGLCEDDTGLIDRAVALLEDPARQNRYRQAARRLLESHCSPESTVTAIERIYQRMLAGAQVVSAVPSGVSTA